ncbi:MAG: maleate cis-trans isomerase [Hyphomicrobiales bacterium]|nr:maleate cis-trans isomerase [Hyphomicrobiales bacterium]
MTANPETHESPLASYKAVVPRARLGFIIPSSNRIVEEHAWRFLPADITPHVTRLAMTNKHKRPLDQLLPTIENATALLADSGCDVITLQCTGTSMSGGMEKEREVLQAMQKVCGKPTLSAASSVMSAMQAFHANRIVFISETRQDEHDEKLRFLREAGLDLLADKAVGLANSAEYCSAPPQLWLDEALAMRREDADLYFISCANIRSTEIIEELEEKLQRPVVTSNQAAFWCALRKIGITDRVPRLGKLFDIKTAP